MSSTIRQIGDAGKNKLCIHLQEGRPMALGLYGKKYRKGMSPQFDFGGMPPGMRGLMQQR